MRRDEREEGRRGVVGRLGMRVRDAERERVRSPEVPKEPVGGGLVGVVEAMFEYLSSIARLVAYTKHQSRRGRDSGPCFQWSSAWLRDGS